MAIFINNNGIITWDEDFRTQDVTSKPCLSDNRHINSEVKVTFLHPQGPACSYKYSTIPDVLTVPSSHILIKVDPRTATGRTYTLTKKETNLPLKN